MARRGTKKQNKRDQRREQQQQREKERYGKRVIETNKNKVHKIINKTPSVKDTPAAESKEKEDLTITLPFKRASFDQVLWLFNRQKPKNICGVISSALRLAYALEKQKAAGKRVVISFVDHVKEDIENEEFEIDINLESDIEAVSQIEAEVGSCEEHCP